MEIVNMHKAKTELSRLVRDVLNGKRVWIARRGQPVIELQPIVEDPTMRVPGLLKGKIHIAEDFDDPSEALNELFEGGRDVDKNNAPPGEPD